MIDGSPRVALCVVTYNSADLIEDLVASLPEGCLGTEWTLVFADNSSTDSTLHEISRVAPDAIVVETGGNLGYAGGVNAAVRAAGEQDAYLILNADVRLNPGCVLALFDALRPGVGIVVPRLVDGEGLIIWSMRREPTLLRAWADAILGAERAGRIGKLGEVVSDPSQYASGRMTDWAEGSTQLVSSECWRMCGPWDESFFLYSEETDFDLRAGDRGLRTWYEPAAVATHLEGGSAGSPQQWSLLVMNRVRFYRKRHGPFATSLFWIATLVREATRALLGKPTSRAAVRDLLTPSRWRGPFGPGWLSGVRAAHDRGQ